jgi:hypothetical protein
MDDVAAAHIQLRIDDKQVDEVEVNRIHRRPCVLVESAGGVQCMCAQSEREVQARHSCADGNDETSRTDSSPRVSSTAPTVTTISITDTSPATYTIPSVPASSLRH